MSEKPNYAGESALHDQIIREVIAANPDASTERQFALGFCEFLKRKAILIDPADPLAGFPFHYSYNTTVPVIGPEEFDTMERGPLEMDIDREVAETKEALHLQDGCEDADTIEFFGDCVKAWMFKHWHNGHFTAGYEILLKEGFEGIYEKETAKLNEAKASGDEKAIDALESFCITTLAASEYVKRFATEAMRLASETTDEAKKSSLLRISAACEKIAWKKPNTFFEAIQLFWFGHELILCESYPSSVSIGRFDYYLTPFYEKDIADKAITREEAWDLVASFWTKCKGNVKAYQNLVLGGTDASGVCSISDLTYICLDVTRVLKYDQPSVAFRWTRNMPDRAWKVIAEVIKSGTGFPAIFNEDLCLAVRERSGIPKEHAWEYAFAGCVEIGIPGKEYTITEIARLNLPKILDLMLHQGKDPVSGIQFPLKHPHTPEEIEALSSFEELYAWYLEEMEYYIRRGIRAAYLLDQMYGINYPQPFLSTLMEGCIDKALDVSSGGALYNHSALNICGIATITDSLMALKKLVYEERRCTMGEYIAALNADFAGEEDLQLAALHHCPKFGNDLEEVDLLAADIAAHFTETAEKFESPRGGTYKVGFYSVEDHSYMGNATGATPDGRNMGKAFANSMAPVQGMDINGPTAMLNSVNHIDFSHATNGMVLDLKMTPTFLEKEEHLEALKMLIETYFARGGMEIQVSSVSRKTLCEAQAHPEQYGNLVVRVSGFSAYFTSLCKVTQDEVIERTEVNS